MKDATENEIPEGMSIAAFCRQRRLPQRRILRLIKGTVLEYADSTDAGNWRVNLTDEIGVAARRDDGSARITYNVTDAGRLFACVTQSMGADLLTKEELAHIAGAARSYYQMAMGEHDEFIIVSRDQRRRFNPNESGYFVPLDEALQRMGK